MIVQYFKKEPVLMVSFVLAVLSAILVPPDGEYLGYINFSVLSILFCLMLVVAGFQSSGLFDVFTQRICGSFKSEKALIAFMTFVCFVLSALVTNDIALITFVPFTLTLLTSSTAKTLIFAVTMETVAANLGSLITPVGNPQNLFLYTNYTMSAPEFFKITLPLGTICALLVAVMLIFYRSKQKITPPPASASKLKHGHLIIFAVLFILCLLSVFGVVHYIAVLAVVSVAVLLVKKELFLKADYNLLITFVCFFVFVGNVARIDAVYEFVQKALIGRELVFSALLSQVISNVPAATMLASFTDDAKGLVLGTNIGGLGTLIASMASLISYRQISKVKKVKALAYIMYFTAVNFAFLVILLCIYIFVM